MQEDTAADSEVLTCRKGGIKSKKSKRKQLGGNNDLGPEQNAKPLLEVYWATYQ